MRELQRAVELNPADPFPRHEIAALLMDEGDYRGAIAQLKEVVRLDPKAYEAHLDLGICYAQKGFYAEAERAYERARALDADDLLLHYNTAALYALWGRTDQALDFLGRALRLDPAKVRSWLSADPMFDALKSLRAFEDLVHGA
jgi:tetratricopeptide (TPR) repeat protein